MKHPENKLVPRRKSAYSAAVKGAVRRAAKRGQRAAELAELRRAGAAEAASMEHEYKVRCDDGAFAAVAGIEVGEEMSDVLYWTAHGHRTLVRAALTKPTAVWHGTVYVTMETLDGDRYVVTVYAHGVNADEVKRSANYALDERWFWDDGDMIADVESDDPMCPLSEPPVALATVEIDWRAEDEHLQAFLDA